MTSRAVLLDCFRAALDAVDARRCVREELQRRSLTGTWHIVAVGKAAGAMAFGAIEALGPRTMGGCIVLPSDHMPAGFDPAAYGLDVFVASHPVPDERSVVAGEQVAQYVSGLPARAHVLFLVSGGASALLEWPRPGVRLADLALVNRWALDSGAPIDRVNAVRRQLSQLKGGGLAACVGSRRALALMVSDVPDDDPRVLGSGLLHAPAPGDAAIDLSALPADVAELLRRLGPGESRVAVRGLPVRMVATSRIACRAAVVRAAALGWTPRIERARLAGSAAEQGTRLATKMATLPDGTLLVAGGETTVVLPATAGRGGRNQHLALGAALQFEALGRDCGIALLAAGTDGIDGATSDAGALVDAGTCLRGRDAGFDPHVSLAAADSGTFLEASGDLLHTGATLTNVGDLVLAAKHRGIGDR